MYRLGTDYWWILWDDLMAAWRICNDPGEWTVSWIRDDENMVGSYLAEVGCTGAAIVTEN